MMVSLTFSRSGLTGPGVIAGIKDSELFLDWFTLVLRASRWDAPDVAAVVLLLVSAVETCGFWLIPGLCLQLVALDWSGRIFGIVFPAPALVCELLPAEVFKEFSVLVLGGWGRTFGTW